jgi:hypothetical protein
MMRRIGRRLVLIAILVGLGANSLPATAMASGGGTHCIFPDGTDFNEIWGVDESVVWFLCEEIDAGGPWRVANGWGVNEKFQYKPRGFVAAGDTPIADFLAKFVGVKVVVNGGTPREQVYLFTDTSRLFLDGNAVNAVTMGVQDPLPVGTHHVESYWRMSAMHCDGFPKRKGGCLPAGDSLGFETQFEVVPSS